MLAKESAGPNFDLPEEVLEVLPSDPFEQLDVARKITSIALSTRVSALESEASLLRSNLTDRDNIIADLQCQIEELDASLSDSNDKLARAADEKENLMRENALLSNQVKKLNRDVSKVSYYLEYTQLEVFKRTLMQSLQEDDDSSAGGLKVAATHMSSHASLSSQSLAGGNINCFKDDDTLPPSRTSSMPSQFSELGNSCRDDHESDAPRPRVSQGLLAFQTSTPRFTPSISPSSLSASVSPTRTSKPLSPRRHSMSFSSVPSSQHSSMSSDVGSQSGRTRVDGKEFFRQVRSRLSYEQFSAFLANVKELNSHKQTKEETLQKADEIFGPDNKDLYAIFEGLITRSVH
ncbi:hypothetical protein RHGRI_012449 [Rhododendron griersonianum]|uniref:At4g15545-like C-terminal domain-containing protein n=1 Tax=Rhododendron griersonianum TaxID=479676 RepID=A0AAV6KQL5_9ERIC|nr:hypothetical protein RHGRI_012449 [Rhododendron griersonianum]